MSEQTKIKHSPAVEGKKHHKVRWIVLAVLLVIVAAVAAWYLIRFEFNRDYQAYIEAPAGAAAQSELAALTDENPNVAAPFQLFAENDNLKLYADLETANVAIYDKRSGETVYSNPVDADADKVANKTNKNYLKSQFLLDYYNAGLTSSTYDSYSMSVALGNFRAAAIDQLAVWCERAGVEMVKQSEGSDPAAVVFDAIAVARKRAADVLIIDTAGRLQNKKNLMNELAKIDRVIDRELPGASRETLLVLDATTGQNAVSQAKEFSQAANITGITLNKLDGTAKGGIVIAIKQELGIPVKFIGVGEKIDDMQEFDAADFVRALFGE